LEVIKQVLSEQQDFDVSQAYLYLSQGKNLKTPLTADSIKDFLSNNDLHYKKKEINRLIRTYDSESNGSLNFLELVQFNKINFFFLIVF
jgi:Ca2+-binding EF-hand superfamily protein